ncbi:MAG: ABC transporter permease [Candidatus Hodarchaeales archaeon]|jgi:ABC-type multidrug transport system permease subunit
MKKALIYSHNTLRQTFRSKEKVSLIFVIPVIFLLAMAFMYGDQSSVAPVETNEDVFEIGVINHDDPFVIPPSIKEQFRSSLSQINEAGKILGDPLETGFGGCFLENLRENALTDESESRKLVTTHFTDINKAKLAVQARDISLCCIIPEEFSKTILTGINYRMNTTTGVLITNDPEFLDSESQVESLGDYSYARFSEAESVLRQYLHNFIDIYTGIELPAGSFTFEEKRITTEEFDEFQRMIPGFIVFVLLMSVSGSAAILAAERLSGTLDRLKISGYSPRNLLLGLSLTQLVTTSLQIIVFMATLYFLGFPGRGNPFYAFLVSLAAMLSIFGFGLLVAALCTDEKTASGLPGVIGIPLTFLAGSWIPLAEWPLIGDIEVWHFNPMYSTSEALRKILLLEQDLGDVLLELAFILGIGLLIFVFSAFVFYKKAYQSI